MEAGLESPEDVFEKNAMSSSVPGDEHIDAQHGSTVAEDWSRDEERGVVRK